MEHNNYISWFLERSAEFKRVLKTDGSFVLNIKEGCYDGQRETWAIELILALRQQGWLWVEEYIWHKTTTHPGKWPNRFRDLWERCLHFSLRKSFYINQNAVMVPIGKWATPRLRNLSSADKTRQASATGSGFGKNVSKWIGRDLVYPGNVLHFSSETGNRKHNSAFPKSLPIWFIKLLSREGDIVLDPFIGSGTTCLAAKELRRHWLGIDIDERSCRIAQERLI